MKRTLIAFLVIAAGAGLLFSQESKPPRQTYAPRPDTVKRAVEFPVKHELAPPPTRVEVPSPTKLKWQPTFDHALDIARTSGRPVLLFQLLGRLDEEFC